MTDALQTLIERDLQKKHTHAILLGVQSADGRIDFSGAAGNASIDDPYFIASVTKMYTTAILMQLVDEGRLDLDANISAYLPADLLVGIHKHEGTDYSRKLKVYQLIHQSSGLADYFEGKHEDGKSLSDDFKAGVDHTYSVADTLDMVRSMEPKFAPEANGGQRSHYSDTNFQLLGAIIESITDHPIADVFRVRLFERLGLVNTYLYGATTPANTPDPLPLYYKNQALHLPQALSSERGTGGIVSTVPESLRFLRAYFDGELFDSAHFDRITQWNALFFPMQYGYGLMRFKLPRLLTLFQYSPELVGHSGSSASFAFYAPKEDLYMAGTFNQFEKPSRPFAFLLRVVAAVKEKTHSR